jgi:hypothetical protein
MNKFISTLVITTVLSALPLLAQPQQPRANSSGGNSPHETTSTVVGDRRTGCRITITYGRPFAKGRKIWGTSDEKALVPYGKAWRLGSDEATLLVTQQPLQIGETTLPAGAYTLYMVPQDNGGKLVFSSKLGGWGIPVDTSHDAASVDLKKETLDKPVEQLTISIHADAGGNGGTIKIDWDTASFSAPFALKK